MKSEKVRSVTVWALSFWFLLIPWCQVCGADGDLRVPTLSATAAYSLYKSGKVILIDTMSARAFKKSHILGAINLPYDGRKDLEKIKNARLPFPKNRTMILYCK